MSWQLLAPTLQEFFSVTAMTRREMILEKMNNTGNNAIIYSAEDMALLSLCDHQKRSKNVMLKLNHYSDLLLVKSLL